MPSSIFTERVSPYDEMLPVVAESPARKLSEAKFWTGRPTPEVLRSLEEESRAPGFDRDRALALLESMGEGLTFTRACEVVGVSRSVARVWCRLVPEFGKLVEVVEVDLGSYWRDQAAETMDPALLSARLRLAAAYDRRISKGGDESGAVVNVQVNW